MDYPKSDPRVGLHNGKFTDGSADGTIKPSLDTAGHDNAITDELLAVIVAAGMVPDEANLHQVRDAIQAMIAAAVGGISIKQKSLVVTGAAFAAGVTDGAPVRWDGGTSKWVKALADGTVNDAGLGIADVTNAEVVLFGETRSGLVSGLTPGSRYYLGVGGGLTATAPSDVVKIGLAKTADTLFVDIDAAAGGGLPKGYFWGLTTAPNSASPTIKIDVAPGVCRSDDDSADITLGAITKQVNVAWGAGNAGGLDAGSIAANTCYHLWAIYNPASKAADVLVSASFSAPLLPAGFTKKRWLGAIYTNASAQVRPFIQRGQTVLYLTPAMDISNLSIAAGAGAVVTLPVPVGLPVLAHLSVWVASGDGCMYIHSPDTAEMHGGATALPPSAPANAGVSTNASSSDCGGGGLVVWTNQSAQVRIDAATTIVGATVTMSALGWSVDRSVI